MKTLDQIAAQLQGYDPQALSVDAATAFIGQLVEPVHGTETVALFDALGRVLAQDLICPIDVPPHDNSAMDGFAFAAAHLRPDAPTTFEIAGTALAGKAWQGTVGPGQCLKIMTGAVMPPGLDTVAPQEIVTVEGNKVTVPPKLLRAGDNRRFAGEDLKAGEPALAKGEWLMPAALGLVASLGIATVPVVRRLKVAYFSTGDEILSLGEPPREGAVYDSNRFVVFGLLTRLGIEVIDMGVVRDEPAALEAAFLQAAAEADAVITSGGVSVGEADHTRAIMKKLGDVVFWRIAMRPGRPMAVGRISSAKTAFTTSGKDVSSYENNSNNGSAVLFGLPGNPVAVMVTFLAFVRPALLAMMGCTHPAPPLLRARGSAALRKKPGRTEYQRGRVERAADGALSVRAAGNQGSGVLSSMVRANGLIVLHHAQGNVAAGDEVDVMMFDGVI
ncbi:MAG: gephyrin-like molybdotransferase Glp [Burkholderiales bacterium]